MLVEILPGPSARACAARLPACFACLLPSGRRVEEPQARFDVKPIGWRAGIGGHHANNFAGLLETDVVAGPDPVMIRERFRYRDLEFAGNLGHALTLARAASLSMMVDR